MHLGAEELSKQLGEVYSALIAEIEQAGGSNDTVGGEDVVIFWIEPCQVYKPSGRFQELHFPPLKELQSGEDIHDGGNDADCPFAFQRKRRPGGQQ